MIYNRKEDKLYCSQCGSDNIFIKSGMTTDLYICNKCGYESRDISKTI